MYWDSKQLEIQFAIIARIEYHNKQLENQREKLSKLYDRVYKSPVNQPTSPQNN